MELVLRLRQSISIVRVHDEDHALRVRVVVAPHPIHTGRVDHLQHANRTHHSGHAEGTLKALVDFMMLVASDVFLSNCVVLVVLARVEAVALVEAAGRRAVLGPAWNNASTAYGTLADAIAATPAGVQDQ